MNAHYQRNWMLRARKRVNAIEKSRKETEEQQMGESSNSLLCFFCYQLR